MEKYLDYFYKMIKVRERIWYCIFRYIQRWVVSVKHLVTVVVIKLFNNFRERKLDVFLLIRRLLK